MIARKQQEKWKLRRTEKWNDYFYDYYLTRSHRSISFDSVDWSEFWHWCAEVRLYSISVEWMIEIEICPLEFCDYSFRNIRLFSREQISNSSLSINVEFHRFFHHRPTIDVSLAFVDWFPKIPSLPQVHNHLAYPEYEFFSLTKRENIRDEFFLLFK